MVDQLSSSQPKPQSRRRKRILSPEEVWVREFVDFTGTTRVTAFCAADLGGVSLTRLVEALRLGMMTWANKCDGPGSICAFEHVADDQDTIEVVVWFEANEEKLEIQEARRIIKEDDSEPPHAA